MLESFGSWVGALGISFSSNSVGDSFERIILGNETLLYFVCSLFKGTSGDVFF